MLSTSFRLFFRVPGRILGKPRGEAAVCLGFFRAPRRRTRLTVLRVGLHRPPAPRKSPGKPQNREEEPVFLPTNSAGDPEKNGIGSYSQSLGDGPCRVLEGRKQ